MQFKELTPILWTNKLEETISFYTGMLGFTCGEKNDEWGWAALHKDEVEVMLARPNEHTPFEKPAFTGSFYFRVEEVDEIWEKLKDVASIVYPIENFPWDMREFAIFDNNGYMLQFGQPLNEDK
jgi:uncharacterized glyoxalase superfamily protein PhnB